MLRIRAAEMRDAAAIARIHIDTWRSTYRGIVPDEYLSNLSYERRQQVWESALREPKTQSVFVAEDDTNGIVGFAASGQARGMGETFDGELYAIYVLQSAQGKGIGTSLVLCAARDLKAHGFRSMLVWVLEGNPYKRFYERLGGEQVGARDMEIGDKSLKELGFGWKNLDLLSTSLEQGD